MNSSGFNRFVRGHLRHYLSWAAVAFIPMIVHHAPNGDGLLLIVFWACLRAYASGYLDKEGRLSISGPFSYVRNPLYLGTLAMVCGVAVAEEPWIALGIVFALGLVLFFFISRAEEKVLAEKFPETFPIFSTSVPRFVPNLFTGAKLSKIRHSRETRVARFSKALFRRNRGYEALIAGLGLIVLLYGAAAAKAHFSRSIHRVSDFG